MRHPKAWPNVSWLFLGAILASAVFTYLTDPTPSDATHFTWGSVIGLALGICFFASRVCWWLLSIFGVVAIGSEAWSIWSEGLTWVLTWHWQSWVNVILQTTAVALLFTPPMVRQIGPFGLERSAQA
jgi:hypothetical protein